MSIVRVFGVTEGPDRVAMVDCAEVPSASAVHGKSILVPAHLPHASLGMHIRVSSLAQAISAFASPDAMQSGAPVSALEDGEGAAPRHQPVAVMGMVDVMNQFDFNGNLKAEPAVPVSTALQLKHCALRPSDANVYCIGDMRQSN